MCEVPECGREAHGRGLCGRHYQRLIKSGTTAERSGPDGCSVDGCRNRHYGNGWCRNHYMRWWRTGTVETPSVDARFWDKVDKRGPIPTWAPFLGRCWVWTAGRFPSGYGCFKLNGKSTLAHRVAYEWLIGPIPEGLEIDHLCRVRGCCNPAHLEPVTPAENVQRARLVSA